MSFTPAQEEAIKARGNVVVVAGAGTGKTRTLVERCLDCLLDQTNPASLDEILIVTFTDAAAAEMRQRIRARLEQELQAKAGDSRWREQLALFETAHIGTLHGFCLRLLRQHFHKLGLDPQLNVLSEEEARLLADDTLEALLQRHYAGQTAAAEAVQDLIQSHSRGWDGPIRKLILKIHYYTQSRPDPHDWLGHQLNILAGKGPTIWEDWLREALLDWQTDWLPLLEQQHGGNRIAQQSVAALKEIDCSTPLEWRNKAATALEKIAAAAKSCPYGKKDTWFKPLEDFFTEAAFLHSVAAVSEQADPLQEDWEWARKPMRTLLGLVQEFEHDFTEAKRELGMVDFQDLEQYALQLLWNNGPTDIAAEWRKKLRFVFVDEYQDINAAQDQIIRAVSRDGVSANRFIVGDVKQSIYRFRLADPSIFLRYTARSSQPVLRSSTAEGGEAGARSQQKKAEGVEDEEAGGRVIALQENFRSREGILTFVNSLFEMVMREEMGGVNYDERAKLIFSGELSEPLAGPCVEFHVQTKESQKGREPEGPSEGLDELIDLRSEEKEARMIALRLQGLIREGCQIQDKETKTLRPVEWRDIAILLRSPSSRSEAYAKEFARLQIPLQVARGGFYETREVSDLLSLLQILDNPLQDVPLLAVLHSPLVGLTVNELATIRLAVKKGPFWTALVTFEESEVRSQESGVRSRQSGEKREWTAQERETLTKVSTFLKRFSRWRRLARQESVSRSLQAVLTETHYEDWLLTQPRGQERHANVEQLTGLAQQFDRFQRPGLCRFLRFIEAQKAAETQPDAAPLSEENAVRLMSIHQSKGLEFPVVVAANLAKPFNTSDLRADIILDENYGLCSQIKPPHTGSWYPSLPYWLASRRQHRELLGEELRLLYVAMTRARDRLILTAFLSQKKIEAIWQSTREISPVQLSAAKSCADWLRLWFSRICASSGLQDGKTESGQNALLTWTIHRDRDLSLPVTQTTGEETTQDSPSTSPDWHKLEQRLSFRYPFIVATTEPAKASVSALRRRAAVLDEQNALSIFQDGAAQRNSSLGRPTFRVPVRSPRPANHAKERASTLSRVSAADVGNAHHTFLQLLSLDRTDTVDDLKAEAQRLQAAGALTADEAAILDFESVASFWDSDLGRKVRAQAPLVRRELPFTARFRVNELASLLNQPPQSWPESEFVIVQGIADLAVIMAEQLWLIDFKTDDAKPAELPAKIKLYEPQIRLYAQALSKIYRRPVSGAWLYFLSCSAAIPVEGLA